MTVLQANNETVARCVETREVQATGGCVSRKNQTIQPTMPKPTMFSSTMPSNKTPNKKTVSFGLAVLLLASTCFGGCLDEKAVYRRPVAELNQKAQQYLNEGKPGAAVGRLEAALDLFPEEPSTMSNLAMAYVQNEQFDEAIVLYNRLLKLTSAGATQAKYAKALAIAYEARADQQYNRIETATEPPAPVAKPSAEQLAAWKSSAEADYRQAIDTYQAVTAQLPEAEANRLRQQVAHLQQRLSKLETGKESADNGSLEGNG
ncbi:MAG: tetratricopeptide repeat protein [Candidatus Melainabacteria bacterium]|nr:tetratricopeptide repeat protein [Candidatus Melainabacteria bacterium]